MPAKATYGTQDLARATRAVGLPPLSPPADLFDDQHVFAALRAGALDHAPLFRQVGALLKEVLRWQPVVPIGLAHTPMADDEFRGHFIPAGAVVIPNSW